jgi:hypothetical protein
MDPVAATPTLTEDRWTKFSKQFVRPRAPCGFTPQEREFPGYLGTPLLYGAR